MKERGGQKILRHREKERDKEKALRKSHSEKWCIICTLYTYVYLLYTHFFSTLLFGTIFPLPEAQMGRRGGRRKKGRWGGENENVETVLCWLLLRGKMGQCEIIVSQMSKVFLYVVFFFFFNLKSLSMYYVWRYVYAVW